MNDGYAVISVSMVFSKVVNMLTEKYNFRISDTMAIPLRPNWISNNAYPKPE